MSDLDQELARRLERLSAAVPARAGQLDPVHVGAVAARHGVRLRWLTPLVALVLGLMAFGVLGVANQRPSSGGTPDPNGGPVGSDRDGDFALTLRTDKRRYAVDEPIDAVGSLTYFGSRPSVTIHTDNNGPIMFGIREKVFGGITVGTMSDLMCGETTLTRAVPLIDSFHKGGSFDGENPDAAKFQAWILAKDLRLPEGTWHLYAVARAPCMGGDIAFNLRTEIEIVVGSPEATPGLPVATEWNDAPVYGGDDIGNMTFQVRSAHPTYDAGTPIDLDAWFTFADGPEEVKRPFSQQVEYRITALDPGASEIRSGQPRQDCATSTMASGEERHLPLDARDVVLIQALEWPAASEQALQRGDLLLPPGQWRITVTVRALFGPCGAPTETWEVHASVEVDVLPKA
ncbi:MAG TPA: hypothetical protein VFI15_00620 [Candidatus Limnocylindrales bacterium]|nr:hypothetical protein [Candidatus Limnocylindrales bacterium]